MVRLTFELRPTQAQVEALARKSRNLGTYWRAQAYQQRRTTQEHFRRLGQGGFWRGVRWARPRKPRGDVNVDTGKMRRQATRYTTRPDGMRFVVSVKYGKYRQAVAPFLFFAPGDIDRMTEQLAEYVAEETRG